MYIDSWIPGSRISYKITYTHKYNIASTYLQKLAIDIIHKLFMCYLMLCVKSSKVCSQDNRLLSWFQFKEKNQYIILVDIENMIFNSECILYLYIILNSKKLLNLYSSRPNFFIWIFTTKTVIKIRTLLLFYFDTNQSSLFFQSWNEKFWKFQI